MADPCSGGRGTGSALRECRWLRALAGAAIVLLAGLIAFALR